MIKKIFLSLILINGLFAINYNNMEALYNMSHVQGMDTILKHNKHTIVFNMKLSQNTMNKLKTLHDKKTIKTYLFLLEQKQSQKLCKAKNIHKFFYTNSENKLVYNYTSNNGFNYKTFINKTTCEFLVNGNKKYKYKFYRDFNKITNHFISQYRKKGYFKLSDLDVLKINVKNQKSRLPIKLDSVTLLTKVSLDEKAKQVMFYDKLLHKPNNKIYKFIVNLSKNPKKLKRVLINYLRKESLSQTYIQNLILKHNWKFIYIYDIEGKKFKIVMDKYKLK